MSKGRWICSRCGHAEPKEQEVNCWECGRGEMLYCTETEEQKMYQGYESWDHWRVTCWLGDNMRLYNRASDLYHEMGKDAAIDVLLRELPAKTEDGASITASTLKAALRFFD